MEPKSMKRIIFVDDDVNIGQGMKRMLRPMRNEWDMVFCTSGEEAVQLMKETGAFDIIVSDMHMPGMGGDELLKHVLEEYPQSIRFCLSGSPGADTVIKTSAIVHQFLAKPCDPSFLLGLIIRAFELGDQLSDKRIQSILMDVGGVPSMPVVYNKIKKAMEDPATTVNIVSELIETDAGLSSKILQIVNTADMGLAQRVTNVVQATTLLGLENIRNLVLMAEVFQPADADSMPENFDLDSLWNHCLQVAKYAKSISGTESIDKEKEIVGATHAEIGGLLLELWGLPDPIVEAIIFHTNPSMSSQSEFSALTSLHVANYFCEDKDDAVVVDAEGIDTIHLEELMLTAKMEEWYDICHEDDDELEKYR